LERSTTDTGGVVFPFDAVKIEFILRAAWDGRLETTAFAAIPV